MPLLAEEGIVYVQVENSAAAAGYMAHNFFGHPSEKMKIVGVTGTNGKTTIATLLYKLFTSLGYKCGLLSTVENHIGGKVVPATHTTPDSISLNALLKQMADEGCTYVFMEASSHAIFHSRCVPRRRHQRGARWAISAAFRCSLSTTTPRTAGSSRTSSRIGG